MSTDDSPEQEFDIYDGEGFPKATLQDAEGTSNVSESKDMPRREVWWLDLAAKNQTLESIKRCFEDCLDRLPLSSSNSLLRHITSPMDNKLRHNLHRCPGYLREEITLTSDVSKSVIISHAFPRQSEVCSICGQLVQYRCTEPSIVDGKKRAANSLYGSHHLPQLQPSGISLPNSPIVGPPFPVLNVSNSDSIRIPPSPTLLNRSGHRFITTVQLRDNNPEEKSGLLSLGLLNPDTFTRRRRSSMDSNFSTRSCSSPTRSNHSGRHFMTNLQLHDNRQEEKFGLSSQELLGPVTVSRRRRSSMDTDRDSNFSTRRLPSPTPSNHFMTNLQLHDRQEEKSGLSLDPVTVTRRPGRRSSLDSNFSARSLPSSTPSNHFMTNLQLDDRQEKKSGLSSLGLLDPVAVTRRRRSSIDTNRDSNFSLPSPTPSYHSGHHFMTDLQLHDNRQEKKSGLSSLGFLDPVTVTCSRRSSIDTDRDSNFSARSFPFPMLSSRSTTHQLCDNRLEEEEKSGPSSLGFLDPVTVTRSRRSSIDTDTYSNFSARGLSFPMLSSRSATHQLRDNRPEEKSGLSSLDLLDPATVTRSRRSSVDTDTDSNFSVRSPPFPTLSSRSTTHQLRDNRPEEKSGPSSLGLFNPVTRSRRSSVDTDTDSSFSVRSPPFPTLSSRSTTLQSRDNRPEEKSGPSSLGFLNPDTVTRRRWNSVDTDTNFYARSPPFPTLSNRLVHFIPGSPDTRHLRDNKPEEKSDFSSQGLFNPDRFNHENLSDIDLGAGWISQSPTLSSHLDGSGPSHSNKPDGSLFKSHRKGSNTTISNCIIRTDNLDDNKIPDNSPGSRSPLSGFFSSLAMKLSRKSSGPGKDLSRRRFGSTG